jgi:uroporphyrinogen decarboxylase
LYGSIRTWLTLEGACYLMYDDEALFDEIIEVNAELTYQCTKTALESGVRFDFAHFWEDICFKNGPLINPKMFAEKVGRHYKRITELVNGYGIDIVSLDCDGLIDELVPIWFDNGVNTMFPIEVGTWNADLKPWRKAHGRELRGVGGMDKRVFARDFAAVDAEIERLKPMVEMGGFLPCPDHRIPEDGVWDNVRYYCDRMHEVFS